MFRSLFEGHMLIDLPVITMVFFFCVFLAVLARVLWNGSKHYEAMASIPLDDRDGAASNDHLSPEIDR
jgi:cbb3-type cytochrome oxidase subunit 3